MLVPPKITCVSGLSGLRAALLSEARRVSQASSAKPTNQRANKSKSNSKSKTIQDSASDRSETECWGYVVDLDGHWATTFCFCTAQSITAILFDTLDVQTDAESLYQAGILEAASDETHRGHPSGKPSLTREIKDTCEPVDFRILLLAPLSEFRRVAPSRASGQASEASKELLKTDRTTRKPIEDAYCSVVPFRTYINNQDLRIPFRRISVQPVLQAHRDDTCLARSIAVLLWMCWELRQDQGRFHAFVGKAQEFEMEAAADYTNQVQSHGMERNSIEPSSRLIASDGAPDRFDRETFCMVQSVPDTREWNKNISGQCREHINMPSELCNRLDKLLDCQNPTDASNLDRLEKAQLHWNCMSTEEQKLYKFDFGTRSDPESLRLPEIGARKDDVPADLSEVSSHSNLLKFLLLGRLHAGVPKRTTEKHPVGHHIDVGGNNRSDTDSRREDLAYVPFFVLPFPKLFERLKVKDFMSGPDLRQPHPDTCGSTDGSSLIALLRGLDVPERHWDVIVSDFELAGTPEGSYHDAEFWNPVVSSSGYFKEVRHPRKLDVKTRRARR
ncbi:unnamed protein product [Prorocentrum cordatum]|nr:unnamed protein product [Polarella glacialis]